MFENEKLKNFFLWHVSKEMQDFSWTLKSYYDFLRNQQQKLMLSLFKWMLHLFFSKKQHLHLNFSLSRIKGRLNVSLPLVSRRELSLLDIIWQCYLLHPKLPHREKAPPYQTWIGDCCNTDSLLLQPRKNSVLTCTKQ